MAEQNTRQNVPDDSPYEPIGFSRAVRVENLVFVAGTGPIGAEQEDAAGQALRAFEIASSALSKAGAGISNVVRTRMFLTHVEDWEAVGRVHAQFFFEIRPAATILVVAQLLNPAWRVEIEMDAVIPATRFTSRGDRVMPFVP